MTMRNALGDLALDATVTAVLTKLNAGLVVTNFPSTQVISGTVAVSNLGGIGLTNTELRASALPVSGTFWQTTQPVSLASWGGLTDTQLRASVVAVNPNVSRGSGAIDANTQRVTLATDGPTVTTLSSIDTKTPAVGQALMSASTPVVIASNQGNIPVIGSFFQATQPVSLASWAGLTDTQLRASAVSVAPNITRGSGITDANTQRVTLASDGPAVTALTNVDTKTPALGQALAAASTPVVLTSAQITLLTPPVAITGFGLELTQQSVLTKLNDSVAVTGPLTNAQLRAAVVPVALDAATLAALEDVNTLQNAAQFADMLDVLYSIREAIGVLASARNPSAELRVSASGVGTLTNQTNIGGFAANIQIPALMNVAAVQSNVNNMVG